MLELAEALKREAPERTAAQVAAIISSAPRDRRRRSAPCSATSPGSGSTPGPTARRREAFGRFEAAAPNELLDRRRPARPDRRRPQDLPVRVHRRPQPGARRLSVGPLRRHRAPGGGAAPRARRPGRPAVGLRRQRIGDRRRQLLRACASARHPPRPRRARASPEGRGKIERFFRTVRDQFLVEVDARGVADLAELNRLFAAWVETVYHRRVHSETGQTPLERFLAGGPAASCPTPAQLHEAFLWSEHRTVTKTAHGRLHGNTYEVDAALVGRRVELRLRSVRPDHHRGPLPGPGDGRRRSRSGSAATPTPRPGPTRRQRRRPTGIDYLGLVDARTADAAELAGASSYPPSLEPRRDPTELLGHRPPASDHDQGGGGDEHRPSPRPLRASSRMPFGRTSPPAHAAPPPPPTPRPSPASAGASTERALGRAHRRGRRRQDRRRPRRARRPRRQPPHHHLPRQPRRRRPRPLRRDRHRARRRAPVPQGRPDPPGRRRARRRRTPSAASASSLVVDEAHLLDPDQLEELRLLTNADMDSRSPVRRACSSANPPCAGGSSSAPSPPSTSASPCATPSPA